MQKTRNFLISRKLRFDAKKDIADETKSTKWCSQIGQDKYIMETIFQFKRNGFFLDIGANDGITLSNTYALEKYFGWNGICFECDPRVVPKLRESRSADIAAVTLFNVSGKLIDFALNNSSLLSGIDCTLDQHRKENQKQNRWSMIRMGTVSLMDYLDHVHAPTFIDYMTVDTEGSELTILSTFDFQKYYIRYITIEHNYHEENRKGIRDLLTKAGYELHRTNQFEDDYYRN